MTSTGYIVLRAEDVEPFTHPDEPVYHSRHILGRESAGVHDLLLNQGTVDPHSALGGTNHPENDEVYFGLAGSSWVDLGGDPDTGVGGRAFRLEPGSTVFVPKGVFHRLRNESDEPFVLLAIWPQPAARGANGVHDGRLDTWGTGFRLREGCLVRAEGDGRRVVEPRAGWDPLCRPVADT
jgi:mannose-6-phosphate isomerase-like protein (cupin superfamily)